jgi:hypothetical protein
MTGGGNSKHILETNMNKQTKQKSLSKGFVGFVLKKQCNQIDQLETQLAAGGLHAPSSILDPEMRVTSFTKVNNNDIVSRECRKNY